MKLHRYLVFLSILFYFSSCLTAACQIDSPDTSIFSDKAFPNGENKNSDSATEVMLKRNIQSSKEEGGYAKQCGFRNRLALLLSDHGRIEESFTHLRKALEVEQAHNLMAEKSETVALFGYTYELWGKKDKAVEYFLQSAFLAEQLNKHRLSFWIYYHLGIIYYNAESYNEAITFLRKAISYSRRSPQLIHSSTDVFSAYNNIGLCYRKMNMYDSAIYFHNACIALSQNSHNIIWKAIAEGNIGIALVGKKQYDSAYLLIRKDLATSMAHQEWRSAAVAYCYLAEISDYKKQYRKAELLFDSAHQLIKQNNLTILSYFNKMSLHYRMIGNYKASYFCLERFHHLRDSLQVLQNPKTLALINANNQFEKKLVELELMAKDNELKAQQLRLQKFVIGSILFITALSIALIVILHRRNVFRRKLNIQLERTVDKRTRKLIEINKQLDTFIYRSSHDMRRPLTTLLGLNYLGQKTVTDPGAKEILRMVAETAHNMDAMLQKLRMIHELNTRKLKLSSCFLQDVLSSEIDKLENDFRKNDIEVTSTILYKHMVTTDSHLIGIIARNLLENAIHFRQPKNSNRVSLTVGSFADDHYFIEIEDKGIGIDKTIRESIFQPFFRGSDQSPGNGLGLFLVKKAVGKLKGTITIESEFGAGSRFRVLLPLN